MPTCPRGHNSNTADFCDECGAPMNATTQFPVLPQHPGPGQSPATEQAAWFSPDTQPCPECGEPLLDRFCEACGWGPGVAPAIPSAQVQHPGAPPTPPPAAPPSIPSGQAYDPFTGGQPPTAQPQQPAYPPAPMQPPAQEVHNPFGAGPNGPPPAPQQAADPFAAAFPPPAQYAQPAPGPWQLIADAVRAYFDRICRLNDLDPNTMRFPEYAPQRRFRLTGPQQLVGRHSASKGISPDIDLSGPPTDAAVSHAHALFIAQPDGRWAVVDVGSANGTFVNESAQPLARNLPMQLNLGDRVHVGLWTTLTVTNGM